MTDTDPGEGSPEAGAAAPLPLAPARRSASLMAVGTLLSRLTGFARTVAVVTTLGISSLGDAYNTANTIPNVLFVLVTGGTLSSVLVPLLAQASDLAERRRRAEAIGGAVVLVTGVATLAVAAAARLIVLLYGGAKAGSPDYAAFLSVTTQWLVLFAPQILCYGVSVYAVAVLNAHGRLALAGFAPVATNVITIAGIAVYVAVGGPAPPALDALGTLPLVVLGAATTLGVAAMAAIQLAGARRTLPGLRLRPRLARHDPTVRRLWRLGRWTFGYVVANQIGLTVVIRLANGASGGVIAYQTAFMIMQLPFAIVAVSIFSATFPRLAQSAPATDPRFARIFSQGFRLTLAFMLPAAVGLVVLAAPLTELLVDYGRVGDAGVDLVTVALRGFGVALLPFTAFQLLTRSYYSLSDTRTPMLANIAVNGVNIVAALTAVGFAAGDQERIAGLVVAFGLSYVAGVALLGVGLGRRRPGVWRGTPRSLTSAAAGSLVMTGALLALVRSWDTPPSQLLAAGRTLALVAVGALVYLAALVVTRSPELGELRNRR